ncbi:MAG TPA: DUF881 domain-containing protein [Actinomycetota bacterium]|nr:DUF881 domain-containing protein [Actinomycetota bacterium]
MAERRQGFVLPVVLVVMGFVTAAALAQERVREEELPGRTGELVDLIRRRQAAIHELSAEVRDLNGRLQDVRSSAGRESEQLRDLVEDIRRLRGPAGLGGVTGPGLVVELEDSSQVATTRGELTDFRIQDVDLQLVVNALWTAGAEAVSINGRRVTSTTAIREAGDAVLVNFTAVSSPYRVSAIGDPEALRLGVADSEIAERFQAWTEIYGLGYSVRTADDVVVPGLAVARQLEWAQPAEE